MLSPLLAYFFVKTVTDTRRFYLIGFLVCTLLNQIVFSNASYPAIQYLVLLAISFVFLSKKHLAGLVRIILLFSILNAPFFFESILTISYQKASLFSNPVNIQLINDTPLTQQRFYSTLNILSFISGRLLEGTRWTAIGSQKIFPISDFYQNVIIRYFLIVPIMLIASSLITKDVKRNDFKVQAIFFASAILVSMFGFSPLNTVFQKIFSAYPLLWIFRNSLKFSALMLIFACFLLYKAVLNSTSRIIFIVYLIIISIYAFKGDFADVHSFTSIPSAYSELSENIKRLNFSAGDRMMAFPAFGNLWLVYSFSYMGFHPLVSFQNQISSFTTDAYASGSASNVIYDELSSLTDKSRNLFQKYSVKYILLNHDLSYNAYRINPEVYNQDKKFLDENFLKLIENQNYSIYQVYDYKSDVVSANGIEYTAINPTKYLVTFSHVTSTRDVRLEQAFSSGWKIYIQRNTHSLVKHEGYTFFEGDEFQYLFRPDDFWWTHILVNGYANQWSINPEDIKKSYNESYYKVNSDGSLDFTAVIYFQPQSYYYLGVVIVFCSILLCVFWIYNRQYEARV